MSNTRRNCGIKINTPELREKIEKLGYKPNEHNTEGEWIIIDCNHNEYYDKINDDLQFHNCENNEEMFLALAALIDNGIDIYQLFKLPNGNVEMCDCESSLDMWGDWSDWVDGDCPVKLNAFEIIRHYEPKILVIYVNSAEDTEDLKLAYEGLNATVLYNPSAQEVTKKLRVTAADTVMILGHGSPSGLFSPKWDGLSVNYSHVHCLKNKKCIGVWCYASEFAIKHDLKGFFTSMFISNKWEAACYGYTAENEEIYEQTRHFLRTLNQLIKDDVPMNKWLETFDNTGDMSKPYVKFNYEALSYFE